MATVYEIVQGLSQAAANAYDGALGEGRPLLDKRVMDGFNVKFFGNMMCLSYHSEVQLKEVYRAGFESDIEQRLSDIKNWLTKEYKKVTGNSVTLTEEGEVDVRVENSSRVRSWVMAKKHYVVGGLDKEMQNDSPSEERLENNWRSFLEQGGWNGTGGDRPDNDTRKKE